MPDFVHALQSGSVSLWVFIPTAILLGALHGLEPGHSKTMMAAFIIAIRGTVGQAVLLGLSAAISHSLLIWLLAALALHYGNQWNAESVEPWLQVGSAVIIAAVAVWMFLRTRREARQAEAHGHSHAEGHGHAHHSHSGHEHEHDHGRKVASSSGLIPPAGVLGSSSSTLAVPGRRGPNGGLMLDTGHGWLDIAVFE